MITKFGSLFAGHVDLDNEGLEGTAANDRWLSDEHLASVFPKSEAIAKLMDRTGYDTFWLAEHHFQREGLRVHPEHPDAGAAPLPHHEEHQDRLRLQHRARCGIRSGWPRTTPPPTG